MQTITRREYPVLWAETVFNLSIAHFDQAMRTQGAEGIAVLDGADLGFRDVQEVFTRAAHPVAWAQTQEYLGLITEEHGDRREEGRLARYRSAQPYFENALSVFGPAGMGQDTARCTESRDRVAAKIAALD